MSVSIDNQTETSARQISQPLLERLAQAVAKYDPQAACALSAAELYELYGLIEDAYGGALPSASTYPAPDLHFLEQSARPAPARSTHRRTSFLPAGQLRVVNHTYRMSSLGLSSGAALRGLFKICCSALYHASANVYQLALAQTHHKQPLAAYAEQYGYDAIPSAIRSDAGICHQPRQTPYWRGPGRPLPPNGGF